jgi:hypothetical protein
MNAAPVALLLAVLTSLWLIGRRRPRPILRSTDAGDVAALNRAQIERLKESPPPRPAPQPPAAAQPQSPAAALADGLARLPRAGRDRALLQQQLSIWCRGSIEQRLAALAIAARWQHPCMLPSLRRALRDPHPAVMAAAARAIEGFRAHPPLSASGPLLPAAAVPRPPRNVVRTR